MLILVFPDTPFREWLEFEYQEAFDLRKPTIGILPAGIDEVPVDLRGFGIAAVPWDAASIRQAILDAVAVSW